ncbi:oxygenase MpaB family protein [Pseudomonas saliphila]|uniref:oxygenase MpaB family protein n=1 Tax=Pseudomonas saliphila TaxID=2586906 RepID=UPI00123B913D|nr:oxygenase MpaB family protein [Pseudomonas saliphila]
MNADGTGSQLIPARAREPIPLTARELDQQFPGILDAVSLLAGGANVILQLARPGVGYGVLESRVESGQIFRRPLKRTRTTLTYLIVALAGTDEEKQAYRQAINTVHAQVYSTPQSPVQYNGFDHDLQLWVAACLYWGFADTWRLLRGEPDPVSAGIFYQRAAALGTTLQVSPERWPSDLTAFQTYWQLELARIHIDPPVRAYLTDIAELKFLPAVFSLSLGPLNRFLTAGFLPPKVREEMHFTWGAKQQKRFDLLISAVAFVNRCLPRVIRQLPFLVVLWDFRRRLRNGAPLL